MVYIDSVVAEGTIDASEDKWELKVEQPGECRVWAGWAGSQFNKDLPMMKTEHYFLEVDDPRILLEAIVTERLQWDSGINKFEELPEYTSEHTSVHRLLMNSVMNLSQREFIDKKFIFSRQKALDHA